MLGSARIPGSASCGWPQSESALFRGATLPVAGVPGPAPNGTERPSLDARQVLLREYRTYVAAPVAVLQRPDWPVTIERVQELVGPVWDPAELFDCTSDWLDRWPLLVPFVRDLVLVPDLDGGIGAGCLREIAEVMGCDRLVRAIFGDELVPWWDLTIRPASVPTRFFVATVTHELKEAR